MFLELALSNGYTALIDDQDRELIRDYTWFAHRDKNTFYAECSTPRVNGERKFLLMHRVILAAPAGVKVDHVNGNGLDNRRCNLRFATHSQNGQNQRIRKDSQTPFKGVQTRVDNRNKWCAYIGVEGRQVWIGTYNDPVTAALAYDSKARELFGEFARVNFPRPGEQGAR